MKKHIHPTYYHDTSVTCACGNTFVTGSTLAQISVSICSRCHPFWTGEQKFIDTEGRVERFERKRETARKTALRATQKKKKVTKEMATKPPTLKQMLERAKGSR